MPLSCWIRSFTFCCLLSGVSAPIGWAIADPPGGALDPAVVERYRVIISTDLANPGNGDFDDWQSMVHLLQYSDVLEIEGLIASVPNGLATNIAAIVAQYENDRVARLTTYSPNYPTKVQLDNVTKQGATTKSPAGVGYTVGTGTPGSRRIVDAANKLDPRPLYVLVWGSLTDVAQAVYNDPAIKSKIRVVCTAGRTGYNYNGSGGTGGDPAASDYLWNNHVNNVSNPLWMVNMDSSFRGMYIGSWYASSHPSYQWGNAGFLVQNAQNHGSLGNYLFNLKNSFSGANNIKAGDTPTVLYMLRGDPGNPAVAHWGGNYQQPQSASRPKYWTDVTDSSWSMQEGSIVRNGAKTVYQFHTGNFMPSWGSRMNRSQAANPGNRPPTVSITTPAQPASPVTAGSTILIQATATDVSPGTISKVEFYNGNTKLGEATGSPYQYSWTNVPQGLYSLRAKAIDNNGAATVSPSPVIVQVNASGNVLPTATVTNPLNGSTHAVGANILVEATASDSDGTIQKVDFYYNNVWVSQDSSSPYQHAWNSATAGTHTWKARAVDNLDGLGYSAPITVTVTAAGPALTISSPIYHDSVSGNAADWSLQSNPASGQMQYGDRPAILFSSLPSVLTGAKWIRTANDSKNYAPSPLVTFTVNVPADVYVAHDDRITTKPSWLASPWVDTGLNVVNNEATPVSFSLYKRSFPAGSISLGSNGNATYGQYTIFAQPTP